MSSQYAWIDELVEHLGFWRSAKHPWRAPTSQDFERLEISLGGGLPEDYRYFVARYGGGMFSHEDYTTKAPVAEACPWGQLVRPELFYPLLQEHPYSIEEQLATYQGRIPRGVLPIADDPGGNQTCIDVAGAFPGSVWFWDHEQRWFKNDLEKASRDLKSHGIATHQLSVHDIIRAWARLNPSKFDRPPDYMGMYHLAPTFTEMLRGLRQITE